jgi:hypothetical protein
MPVSTLLRPYRFAAAPWTPADLPGLVHWWHAELSTKTGSPGAISQINDLVGSLNLVQADGTRQPTDNVATINSEIALNFDGTDSLRVVTGPSVSANGTLYAFWIGKIDSLVDFDMLWHTGGSAAGNDGVCLRLNSTAGRLMLMWSNGTTAETYSPAGNLVGTSGPHLVEAWVIGTTGGVNIRVDGVLQAGATNTVGFNTPEETDWFARAGTLNLLDGQGGEWGIATTVAAGADATNLLAYSQSYWGTP